MLPVHNPNVPAQRIAAVTAAVERYERAADDLIEAMRADPEAAEHLLWRLSQGQVGFKVSAVISSTPYRAQAAYYSREALARRGIPLSSEAA